MSSGRQRDLENTWFCESVFSMPRIANCGLTHLGVAVTLRVWTRWFTAIGTTIPTMRVSAEVPAESSPSTHKLGSAR